MRRAALLVALLLAFPPRLGAEPPSAPSAQGAPFLWEVTTPATRHFLMGSVHLLPPSAHPLPAALEAAYVATRALVLETDLTEVSSPELQGRMLGAAREDRPGGLKAQIGRSLYAKLQKRARSLGMPTPVCDAFRAWFCALALELYPLQQAQFSIEYGIDQHFHSRARDDGRPVSGLEPAAFQVALFAEMPDAMGKQILAATLDETTYTSQSPEELHRIWRNGDTQELEQLMKDMRKRYPELHARLLTDRNRAWVAPLAERLGGDVPHLVIVGAAHFVGADGLLALLKARGIEARPAPGVIELADPPESAR